MKPGGMDGDGMCSCEMPAISETTDVRAARKPHQCSECGIQIDVGQPYQRYDSLFDGRRSHYRFCVACQAAWNAVWALAECPCELSVGEVWNGLDDEGIATPFWRYDHYRERVAA